VFQKVLIANRGEIAIRVQRALRELGVRSVAVYSDVDVHAPHVTRADEAYRLGAAEASASYLNQERLVEVARDSGCDALHPGYGFLSENASFARRCGEAGITFIGPPADAIEAMGDKLRARDLMRRAGVPVVPGTRGGEQSSEELERAARKMRFPVLIKASAGGGGKGMRIVRAPEEFARAAEAARGEAEQAFGDGTLYVEKYLDQPRHVEFQVFADRHGNVVHLFERECSIQRRHQKIIEEAPSPALTPKLRQRMGEAAVEAARAVGYEGAGTIEFLLDASGKFYFLEMNTRLQVEHPVTEFVTGLDIVRMQVEVAAGAELAPEAREPQLRGHAFECRVYAEDPEHGFLPASGRILRMRYPEGPGVRVDGALRDDIEISIHYDPLLAKVVTYGRDRQESIRRMQRALCDFVLLGIPTNLRFLQEVFEHEAFERGALTTHFIDEHMADWKPEAAPVPDAGMAALLLHELVGSVGSRGGAGSAGGRQIATPWSTLTGWHHDAGGEG
jgi:acetyl-CoA carboxylase biotin carboxylase subunit